MCSNLKLHLPLPLCVENGFLCGEILVFSTAQRHLRVRVWGFVVLVWAVDRLRAVGWPAKIVITEGESLDALLSNPRLMDQRDAERQSTVGNAAAADPDPGAMRKTIANALLLQRVQVRLTSVRLFVCCLGICNGIAKTVGIELSKWRFTFLNASIDFVYLFQFAHAK